MAQIRGWKEGALGWLVFDNPQKMNAINYQMWQTIPRILSDFEGDPEIRVIIIRRAGNKSFTSGADMSEFKDLRSGSSTSLDYNLTTKAAYQGIKHCSKPVVAMVHGFCLGGGLGIALQADLRVASKEAIFSLAAVKRGIAYGYEGISDLIDIIGPAIAKEIFFTGQKYSAKEAFRMGLIHQMVPKEDLEIFTEQYCLEIAQGAPLAIKAIKIAINEYLTDVRQRDLARVEKAMSLCSDSEDYQEGYQAFLEKRLPQFKGK